MTSAPTPRAPSTVTPVATRGRGGSVPLVSQPAEPPLTFKPIGAFVADVLAKARPQ